MCWKQFYVLQQTCSTDACTLLSVNCSISMKFEIDILSVSLKLRLEMLVLFQHVVSCIHLLFLWTHCKQYNWYLTVSNKEVLLIRENKQQHQQQKQKQNRNKIQQNTHKYWSKQSFICLKSTNLPHRPPQTPEKKLFLYLGLGVITIALYDKLLVLLSFCQKKYVNSTIDHYMIILSCPCHHQNEVLRGLRLYKPVTLDQWLNSRT